MSSLRHTPADERHFLVRGMAMSGGSATTPVRHVHRWPQLLAPTVGVLAVWTETGSWIVPAGSGIWAPANILHAVSFSGAAKLNALYFRPDTVTHERAGQTGVVRISPLLNQLIDSAVLTGMLDERVPVQQALATLLCHSLAWSQTPAFELIMPSTRRLHAIVAHARETHFRKSAAGLAASASMSCRTLERQFFDDTGQSLGSWLRQARLIESLRGLADGLSVKVVAARAGYNSPSAYIAAFRARFHTTPAQFFAADSVLSSRTRRRR